MSAREHILGVIRRRLNRPAEDEGRVAARLQSHPAGPVPAVAAGNAGTLRERFVEKALAASAEVERLEGPAGLPVLVGAIGRDEGDPVRAAVAPHPLLEVLDWKGAGVEADMRAGEADDRLAVSVARFGVAETGTLVLTSGPDSPTTLNFLPDIHVVLLHASEIVGGYEEGWARLRQESGMPRTVNWITGPSRSADIEQRLQLGAHGPIRLVIALV